MGFTSLPIKWAGKAAKPLYHSFCQKDTGNAKSRTFLQRKGSVLVQPLSLASLDSSPSRGASGETVHFAGTAKASPFGRGVTEGDGEGKPGRKEPLRSDGQALCQSDTIAVSELFGSSLALSVGLAPASSPRGGAIGMSVSFRLDERSTISRKQQCSAVQASDSLTRSVVQKPLSP